MTRWCLVVEDESPLGEMICDNLSVEGYGVEIVRDGEAAARRIANGGLDLVLLDVMLPGRNGFEVLEEMRSRGDETPVLILSARAGDDDRIRGLELGADDYLGKPFNLRELLLRVASLMRRQQPVEVGGDTVRFGDNEVDFRSRVARAWNGTSVALSDSETKMLRLLSTREGATVSRRDVVDVLYGPRAPVTVRTLDNVMANLRRHFERDGKHPRHFHTVRGVGWRFERC